MKGSIIKFCNFELDMSLSFLFTSDPISMFKNDEQVVIISKPQDSKEKFMVTFAAQANFPEYFGKNWDAFDECLHDLSWLKTKSLLIIHEVLPLSESENDQKTYLKILYKAVLYWSAIAEEKLIIVFPERVRKKIEQLLRF